MDSCRGKDNWTNEQKPCQCLIGRKGKRYRRRNPLIALSLKDRGWAGSVIADGLKVSQNTTVEMGFRGGYRQEACNDAGCRQICGRMRRNRILRQSGRIYCPGLVGAVENRAYRGWENIAMVLIGGRELIQFHFAIKGGSIDFQCLGSLCDIIVHRLERVVQYLPFHLFKRQDFGSGLGCRTGRPVHCSRGGGRW